METLTPCLRLHSFGKVSLIPALRLRPVLPPTPDVSRDRFPHAPQRHGLSFRTVSRLRPPGLGFAIGLQARQHIRPNRVPLVRTGRSPSVAPHLVSPRRSYGRL